MALGARAKTSRPRAQSLVRKRTAFELRLEGWRDSQIAEHLGITRQRVHQMVLSEISAGVPDENVKVVREVELAKLEQQTKRQNELIAAWRPQAMSGDVEAAKIVIKADETLIKIGARFAGITGIDAPTKSVMASGDVSGATPAEARQVMRDLFGAVGPAVDTNGADGSDEGPDQGPTEH